MRWTKAWLAAALTAAALACFKTAAKKAAEVRECSRITMDAQGAAQCLVLQYKWKQAAALTAATADSLWRHDASKHRQEVTSCTRQRKMQAGSCLQLYYKWSPERALAVDDSIRRAQMRR